MYDYRRGESVLGAFLLGGIIGAALGLLLAPHSGKENREILAGKAREYWGEGVEFYETGRERVTEVYQTGREKATETADELRVKIDAARERLRDQAAEVAPKAKEKVVKVGEAVKSGVDVAEEKAASVLDKFAAASEPAEPETPPLL